MTCISEYYHGKARECGDGALPSDDVDSAALSKGVASGVVVDYQNDEVGDGDEGDEGGVFEAVQTAEDGEGDDY